MSSSTTPDLSQRWRFCCPECGSVNIRKNAERKQARNNRVNAYHGKRGMEHNFREPRAFHCKACGASFDQPIDRKENSS